jgi:hypothetical protein
MQHSPEKIRTGHLIPSPDSSNTHTTLGIPQKNQYAAPHICASTRPRPDRTDKADDFLAKSHSRTQDPGVRFEGWRGLPKMNQASPREAGHKPAF